MAFYDRIPSARDIDRNGAKIGGFLAGFLGTLLFGLLIGVVYTGQSAFVPPMADPAPVYPNF